MLEKALKISYLIDMRKKEDLRNILDSELACPKCGDLLSIKKSGEGFKENNIAYFCKTCLEIYTQPFNDNSVLYDSEDKPYVVQRNIIL